MPSSDRLSGLCVFLCVLAASAPWPSVALGQKALPQPAGFAIERLYASAPGGGWLVLDALDMGGGLGASGSVSAGYEKNPLRVTDGVRHVAVVSDRAFTGFGFAVTFERYRVYLNLEAPLATEGQAGAVGRYGFVGPSFDLGANPDTLSDARLGIDARLVGERDSALRMGFGAQLYVPNGKRADLDPSQVLRPIYDTDGTYRAMARWLVAGDVGRFAYAGQLGVHIRPLDDSPIPGSPQGSELLFGVACGLRTPMASGGPTLTVGPEIYGATAFRSFFGATSTAVEGLLTGRYETPAAAGPQLRLKLGLGTGIDETFGAPAWRVALAIELLGESRREFPPPR